MKKSINKFNEEITTNFSKLFVETYMIRYLNNYNDYDLLENIKKVKEILNKKIDNEFKKKLKK